MGQQTAKLEVYWSILAWKAQKKRQAATRSANGGVLSTEILSIQRFSVYVHRPGYIYKPYHGEVEFGSTSQPCAKQREKWSWFWEKPNSKGDILQTPSDRPAGAMQWWHS